jgi:hypothetical protein
MKKIAFPSKYFTLLLLAGVLCAFRLHEQNDPPRFRVPDSSGNQRFRGTIVKENALLWQITGKNLAKPSYIYGTIHAICPQDMDISAQLKEKFKQSDQLVLELDMDEPGFMMASMKGMLMENGQTLKGLLSESDYQLLDRFFTDSLGMSLAFFGSMKPLLTSAVTYSKLLGCEPQAYETVFMDMAKAENKEVLGLEKVEDQLAIFQKIPYQKQADLLVEGVKDYSKAKQQFKEMIDLYKKGDIGSAYKLIKETSTGMEEYEGIMLKERNQNWIPQIEKMAKEKPTFFAVGAGHLAGEEGLINLLRKKGYKVIPLK